MTSENAPAAPAPAGRTARIVINDLEVNAIIGVRDHERTQPQRLRFDVRIDYDITAAAQQERLDATLDYSAVCRRIAELAVDGRYLLVETLVTAIADALEAEFGARSYYLRAVKPDAVPAARGGVGVEIERRR